MIGDIERYGELQADVAARRKVDFGLRKSGEEAAVNNEAHISVWVEGGEMNQAAGDAALWGVGGTNAANDAATNRFASVIDLDDLRSYGQSRAAGRDQAIELDFQRGGIVL